MSASARIELDEATTAPVFGVKDCNLRAIGSATGTRLAARGGTVAVSGDSENAVATAAGLVEQLAALIGEGVALKPADIAVAARLVADSPDLSLRDLLLEQAIMAGHQKRILPRSPTQQAYVQSIRTNDIVFGIGPAGTGKTYLAVAMALQALRERRVRRIVLTRPAVEAGEKLGFLPGDLVEKVNPYLRPLHDAIQDLADVDLASTLLDRGELEVAPLAFMRGRTLNDSFIILDEAQNSTADQMKMFLTRMGMGSRMVVTGDVTQVDLPSGRLSGLRHAARLLSEVDGIGIVRFTDRDVVRHRLVRQIIRAYERDDERARDGAPGGPDAPGTADSGGADSGGADSGGADSGGADSGRGDSEAAHETKAPEREPSAGSELRGER